jgi:hypothetical protein
MRGPHRAWTQGAALLTGAALALLALSGWTVSGGTTEPPAELELAVARSSQLDIRPGVGLASRQLAAGSPAVVVPFGLFNATGGRLDVRIRADRPGPELDASVILRMRLGSRTLFEGSLGELHRGASRPFSLASHERARVTVRAWIPRSARDYGAWAEQVTLVFDTSTPHTRS